MGINVTLNVLRTVKTESATHKTEPARHVNLVGQDNFAI